MAIEIPHQLKNENFRFVLLKPKTKQPFEKHWQNKEYKYNHPKLLKHINEGGNYGIIGGKGGLVILDKDKSELNIDIDTFTVKTGSGGRHYYLISDYKTNHVFVNELGELRANNYQVVCPGSIHPNGNKYEVIKNLPIKKISSVKLGKLIKPYLRGGIKTKKEKERQDKDTSRSGLEYRRAIAEFRNGKSRKEIKELLMAYKKFADSGEQYQEITLNKAEEFVLSDEKKSLIDQKPSEENLKVLKNKNLFNEITEKELDKKIVGEVESRKVIMLCAAGGRLVENSHVSSYNVFVNDETGAGKDYTVNKSLEILPEEFYIRKTRISPTVFTYWHNFENEPDWTWDGKVLYLEDISNTVMNSDVFKVMCSSGSSATITIKQKAVDIKIVGKPVIIITAASAIPNPELIRRFVILNLDSSENQTKKIMERQAEFKKKGIIPEYDNKYKDSLKFLKRVKVKIPFADLITEFLPTKNIMMRTHYPRFLDFISASAAFHQYQRKRDDDNFILAEGQDYDIARLCLLKVCSNKYMITLTINQKKILDIFESNPDLGGSAFNLHTDKMNFISLPALQTNLGILVKYGILETHIESDSWNRDREVYSLSESYNPNEKLLIPTFKELQKKMIKHKSGNKGVKGVKSHKPIINKKIPPNIHIQDD